MDKAQIISALSEARLFQALPEPEIQNLVAISVVSDLAADTTVFFQGDITYQVFVILSGLVSVETLSEDGKTVPITSLEGGEVFGEMAVLDQGVRSANIRTLLPTKLLTVSKTSFDGLIDRYPGFSRAVIGDLVRRLRISDQQIEAITLLPLRSRLASLLLDLFRIEGREIKTTQNNLADRLSATREKVNGHLQSFKDIGAVELGRGRIAVLDPQALKDVMSK